MSLLTQKILSLLVYPLTQGLLIFCLAGLFLLLKWRRASLFTLLFGLLWLVVWSLPVVSDWFQEKLEAQYPPVRVSSLPQADAIVVLGGCVEPVPDEYAFPNLTSAGDRPLMGARLYHAHKAPRIVISAGAVPWSVASETESVAMQRILVELAVPEKDILLESNSASTYENAIESYKLLRAEGKTTILLVTSAWHMKRAKAVFEQVGFDVIPVATDYESLRTQPYSVIDWLPSAKALERSTRTLKEFVGLWVYQRRGWL
jgi:uncharacterized SAM-binding protein YcdF (DUF218 family)